MSFPSVPSSVDQYVREILNKMLGRTGNTGDKVVTYNDLAESGLLIANPQALNNPSSPNQSINDSLTKPDTGTGTGGTVGPGTPVVEPPTTPVGLKTAGIFGAIVLEWTPPRYSGHSYTEIYRAQVDDVTQSAMTHVASGYSYTDIVETQAIYYYWIRHVNSNGQHSNLNQVAGTPGQASADPSIILDVVKGKIDDAYYTPEWAAHTKAEEAKLAQAELDITDAELLIGTVNSDLSKEITDRTDADTALNQRVDTTQADLSTETTERKAAITTVTTAYTAGDNALALDITQLTSTVGTNTSNIINLDSTTQDQAQSITQLETTDGIHTGKITTLEQTTSGQATQITQLTTTTGENTAAITEQKTATDGLMAEYTIKVSQETEGDIPVVTGIALAAGRETDDQGNSLISEIAFAAQNFFFSTPNGLHSPFSIVDIDETDGVDYKISMNADVLINGDLQISNLKTGELPTGTTLSIGNGSVEMATATDGTGHIVISGAGGIQTNDYMILNAGRIQSYVYVPSVGHVPYKEVKRVETGTASNGQQVKVPAYFRSQPAIHLYPRDLTVYNEIYKNQSQKIEMFNSAPVEDPTEPGAWLFTPYVRLVVASGSIVESINWTYSGSSNSQEWTATGITDLKNAHITCRFNSLRRTSGTTYQNRQVTIYLDYKLSSSGTWSLGNSEVSNLSEFSTNTVQIGKALSTNTYDIRVRFVAADRSGTFTDGNPTYNYTDRAATGPAFNKTYSYLGNSDKFNIKAKININMPSMSGWEVLRIKYRYTFDLTIRVRYRYYRGTSPNKRLGEGRVRMPKGNDEYETYQHKATTDIQYWDWNTKQFTDETIEFEDTSYKNGEIKPDIDLYYTGAGYDGYGIYNYNFELTSEIILNIKSITATVYYRQQVSNPVTSNNFFMDSARYDKGEQDISLDNAVVTWMATSSN